MGCNCGKRRVDPATGRVTAGSRNVADGGGPFVLTTPDGRVEEHADRHSAAVARVRAGGLGTITPAPRAPVD